MKETRNVVKKKSSKMMQNTEDAAESASRILKETGVKWLHIQFMDLFGRQRSVSFPAGSYMDKEKWGKKVTFDASSCGMASVNLSDMQLKVEPSTLVIYPWCSGDMREARVLARIVERSGEASPLDSMSIAEKADNNVKKAGFTEMELGPEMEFYLFHSINEAMQENDLWHPAVKKGIGTASLLPALVSEFDNAEYPMKATSAYFLPDSKDTTTEYRNILCDILMDMGIPVKYHHHEGGSRQVEVEFDDLPSSVSVGEATTMLKHVSRYVGQWQGLLPSFMPKPLTGDSGSGMHLHVHLKKGNKSAFLGEDEKLSQTGRYFVGGVLDRVREMGIILNPTVNSYRRLVPGFEAPRYTVWAYSNRSSLIRIPPVKGDKMDVEVRNADATCNPYLMSACILEAGLEGIRKKKEPGDPIEEDVDHMTHREIKERDIGQIPSTLGEAIEAAEDSDFLSSVLGKEVLEVLLDYKRKEWQGYLGYATPWEIFHYFDV